MREIETIIKQEKTRKISPNSLKLLTQLVRRGLIYKLTTQFQNGQCAFTFKHNHFVSDIFLRV